MLKRFVDKFLNGVLPYRLKLFGPVVEPGKMSPSQGEDSEFKSRPVHMKEEKLELARKKAKELAEKTNLGSCVETNKELVKELKAEHIWAELAILPRQNHIVTIIGEGYILDPLLTKDYGVGEGRVLFSKKEHVELMKKVARKKPFNAYMDDKDVTYKKIPEGTV